MSEQPQEARSAASFDDRAEARPAGGASEEAPHDGRASGAPPSSAAKIAVGDHFIEMRPDGTEIEHRVTWVGTKKARLHTDLGYAWQTATVWIDRFLDSPDWRPA